MKKEPCPHCLRRKNICEQQRSKYEWYYRCTNCGLSGPIEVTKEEAIAAWNALSRRLRFSKEKPTTPDFYWNRDGNLLRVGEILEISGALFCHFAGEHEPQLLELVGGEWAGPIQEPEE